MTDQNQNPSPITQSIIDELGLNDLPADKQEQLLIKMTEVVLQRIFVETMDKLAPVDQEEYEKMIDREATPEEMEAFLKGKIAGYDEMIKKVVDDFKEEMKKEV
jgi:hypothetical protein